MFKFVKKDLVHLGMPKHVYPKIYFEFYDKWLGLRIGR